MYIVTRDEENWDVESKGRRTSVHVPFGSLFSKIEFEFYGIISDFWISPFDNQEITSAEESEIEQALLGYFRRRGITIEVHAPDLTPPMLCKLDDGEAEHDGGKRDK